MFRRKDGRWQEAVTVDGHRLTVCGKTKAEVVRKLADIKERQTHAKSPLWEDLADSWWNSLDVEQSTMSRGYRPGYLRAVEAFRGRRADSLVPQDFTSALLKLSVERKWSAKTAQNQRIIFSSICRFGVDSGILKTNPVRDSHAPKGLRRKIRENATEEDLKKIMDNISNGFGLFPNIAIYTGLRRGEIMALRWEDIDFENAEIRVNKSVGLHYNMPYIKSTKTQAGERVVPIPAPLLEELKRRKGGGYIFQTAGGELITNSSIEKRSHRFFRELGVSCTMHQLRHAYITKLVESDLTPKDVQYLAGHKDIHTTLQIYTHVTESRRKEAAEKVKNTFAHDFAHKKHEKISEDTDR